MGWDEMGWKEDGEGVGFEDGGWRVEDGLKKGQSRIGEGLKKDPRTEETASHHSIINFRAQSWCKLLFITKFNQTILRTNPAV